MRLRCLHIFIILLLAGCSNDTLEKDMDNYCNCLESSSRLGQSCAQIMEEIVKKYEFDPEAPAYISQRIKECNAAY